MPKNKDRQTLKRRQIRGQRKNAKRKERRQIQAREKHRLMSRQKDIDNLSAEIEAKQKELRELQTKVTTYSQEVQEAITATLKKAGVYDKVNKMEEERRSFQQEAQQRANTLQAQINDLAKMRNWLVGQDKADEDDGEEPEDPEKAEKKPEKKAKGKGKAKDEPGLKVVDKGAEAEVEDDDDGPKKPSL